MRCSDIDKYVGNLIKTNRHAGVAPAIIDLIESYARLCLSKGFEPDFYGSHEQTRNQSKPLVAFLKNNEHLDKRISGFLAAYWQEMDANNLACVLSSEHLAHTLSIPLDTLYLLARSRDRNYRTFTIRKSNGTDRFIQAPDPQLKAIQRTILDTLLQRVPLNAYAEGFRPKRSVLTNASHHLNQQLVVKLDIKDFFPSISQSRVKGMFLQLGYPRQVAQLLTGLTTYRGKLPTGAPTSPVIGNIICRRLDQRMAKLGEKAEFKYSRYADDLTFSGKGKLATMIPFFREIIQEEGFALNEKKIKLLRNGRRQSVTGLVVNQVPNISKKERKKLRAVLHNCLNGDLMDQKKKWAFHEKGLRNHFAYSMKDFKRSLHSKVHYVRMVNKTAGDKLLTTFRAIQWLA